MAEKIPAVRLRTNIPEVLTLSAVYYSAGKDWTDPETNKTKKLPPTLALVGDQSGKKIKIYVPLDCGKPLSEAGFLVKTGTKDRFGGPAFEVHGHPRIQVLKVEDGKHKTTHISGVTTNAPQSTTTTNAPHATAVGGDAGLYERPPKAPAPPGLTFALLGDRYREALNQTIRAYREAGLGAPNAEQLFKGAAGIYIDANKQGLNP